VLTGQTIDRQLYDALNSYTGELGSDGVVRVPAANLNASLVRLVQDAPSSKAAASLALRLAEPPRRAPRTAFLVLPGKSHSGDALGILRSVKPSPRSRGAERDRATLDAILAALRVRTARQYSALCDEFDARTRATQAAELVEREDRLLGERVHIHDRRSMLLWRLRDDSGATIADFDLLFTAGPRSSPDALPEGFVTDRQRNQRDPGVLAHFFNHDLMLGCAAIERDGEQLRPARRGTDTLGLRIDPRPSSGFVHYLPAELVANSDSLRQLLAPNETTLVEIVLRRNVHEGVFRLVQGVDARGRFDKDAPGPIA